MIMVFMIIKETFASFIDFYYNRDQKIRNGQYRYRWGFNEVKVIEYKE